MKNIDLQIEDMPQGALNLKMPTMPLTTKNIKGHSRMSSSLDGLTNASSMITDRYNFEIERLDWSVPHLTEKHKKMYDACNKYAKENTQIHFDFLASNYEGMYTRLGYPDPEFVANYCSQFAKKNKWNPANVKVLDMACGTGLVGKYLSNQGFKNIYGCDVSPNMLDEASNKGIYKELDEYQLGNPEDLPEKYKNQFDFVTCAGLINNNHMDYLLFEEMLLSCKQGGYMIFAARFSYMGKYWYDDIIQEMHNSMRWKLLATETFFKYDQMDETSIGRFSKTPCKVFVFQKLQEDIRVHVDKINDKLKNFLKNKSDVQSKMASLLASKLTTPKPKD